MSIQIRPGEICPIDIMNEQLQSERQDKCPIEDNFPHILSNGLDMSRKSQVHHWNNFIQVGGALRDRKTNASSSG